MDVFLLALLVMAGWFAIGLLAVLVLVTIAHYFDGYRRADRRHHAEREAAEVYDWPLHRARAPHLYLINNDAPPVQTRRGA